MACSDAEACKIDVAHFYGAGLIKRRTGICAAIKTTKLASLNDRSDFTWETFPLFMWTGYVVVVPNILLLYTTISDLRLSTASRSSFS